MNWNDTLTLFADALPGFEPRAEQTNLAHAIEAALEGDDRLLAQAGTGTGKSFAGLAPALNWSLRTGQKVVVGTATKALQGQYVGDLTFLEKLYAEAGEPITWTVVKGRANYACKAKLAEDPAVANLAALREELGVEDASGDLDDLITEIAPHERGLVSTTSDECPGRMECPLGQVCFAELAKDRAKTANVIVVNHSLLIADTLTRMRSAEDRGMIPDAGALVIDEAHELGGYTTNALGSDFSRPGLEKLGKDVASFTEEPNPAAFTAAVLALFTAVEGHLTTVKGNRTYREDTKRIQVRDIAETFGQLLLDVHAQVDGLADQVDYTQIHGDDRKQMARKRLLRRCESMRRRIGEVITAEADELVRWAEADERRGALLSYAPLEVGKFLAKNVWRTEEARNAQGEIVTAARPRPAILLSATLAVGGNDFSFIARELGLRDYTGFDAGTPFDYPKQAALYIPKGRTADNPQGFPDPSRRENAQEWRAYAQTTMESLVRAAGGRALLLFTSREAMTEAHAALAGKFEELGLQVLMQGQRSNKSLTEEFKADETSVLFAMKSFMTGFSVPGDALRLVILDKMPFGVPTDVINAARCEVLDRRAAQAHGIPVDKAKFRSGGSFFGLTVPEAILTLLQAVGRLIRTKDDEGLMAILDPRLSEVGGKNYAPLITGALPPVRRLANIKQAREYLGELAARRD